MSLVAHAGRRLLRERGVHPDGAFALCVGRGRRHAPEFLVLRTADLAEIRPDGRFDLLGRSDGIVKVGAQSGFRCPGSSKP